MHGHGLKATGGAQIQITPVNDPPEAKPDLMTTTIDSPVAAKVLGNDTDVDGDPLTVVATSVAFHGSITINGGKTITYTPSPGYSGTDSFTYDISDGAGGIDTAVVSVFIRDNSTAADLAVTQSVTPPIVITNQLLTFRLTATNRGSVDATAVLLLVNLTGDISEPTMSTTRGSFTNKSGTVRFDLGSLAAGASASATIEISSPGPGTVTSSATIQSLTPDSSPQNNHALATASISDGNEPAPSISNLGDRIRLTWDNAAQTFKPEFRQGLGDSSPWRRIPGHIQTENGNAFLDIFSGSLSSETAVFFRLVRP